MMISERSLRQPCRACCVLAACGARAGPGLTSGRSGLPGSGPGPGSARGLSVWRGAASCLMVARWDSGRTHPASLLFSSVC